MFKKHSVFVVILVLFALVVSPAYAQLPQISNGLSYLTSSQNPDGTWGNNALLNETTAVTASSIETLKILDQTTGSAYTNATAWLQGQSPGSVDYIAERIYALSITDNSINALIPLLDQQNRAWGGDAGDIANNLDTASTLQALKAANYSDQTVIFGAITYLLSTQNPDGGWGFAQDDDSNVYVTAQVISALAQYKDTFQVYTQLASASAFLLSKQNPDGGFGVGSSTVYESALAFIALIESGQAQGLPLQNALNYLTATQSANGSWNDDPYSTALALRALSYVKPDLAITAANIAVSPISPTVGDSLTVTATVGNIGLEAATGVVVRLLDNGASIGELTIPAINPGATATTTFAIAPLAAVGEHVLTVAIDPANAINEVSKANNSATVRLWAKAPADLVVTPDFLTVTPAYPKPGESVTLSFAVANMGESAAGSFAAILYDGDPNAGGTQLGTVTIPGIAAGAWGEGSATFTLASAGVHTLTLVVDPQHAIIELSTANNTAQKTITVNATSGTGFIDLAIPINGIRLDLARPTSGATVTVNLSAVNFGTEAATADLELFDGDPATGGLLLYKAPVTLNAGETRNVAVPWQIPVGIRTLHAYIDRTNAVAERDETNNSQALAVMADMVDIEVSASDIAIEPEHPMDGDPATVKITVQNRGIKATGPFTVSLYNGDPATGGALLQSFAVADLPGDGVQELAYPFTAVRGTYRFYAVCDPDNRVAELYEDNNTAIRALLVKSSAEAKGPDLVPLEFDLSAATTDPQSLRISGTAMVKFQNKGDDKVATPFRITVFEDKDGDGLYTEGTDLALGFWDYSTPMNPNMVGVVTINLAGTVTFRDAPIYAMLDSGQAVFEQNESNNSIRRGSACENRPVNPIEPVVKWRWKKQGYNIPAPPMVVRLTDHNGDGKIDENDVPDIVFGAYSNNPFQSSFAAVRGDTGEQLFFVSDPNHPVGSSSWVAVGDIDGDGVPEIIAPRGGYGTGSGLLAYAHDGTLKWDNKVQVTAWNAANWPTQATIHQNGFPVIADIDGDGKKEIVMGATVINSDGSIRWANRYSSASQYNGAGTGSFSGSIMYASIVADLDLDGKQEIVAGNTAYNADGSIKWWNKSLADGLTAVGNFDDDPYPEVVLVNWAWMYPPYIPGASVYLLDHNGNIKWGPVYLKNLEPDAAQSPGLGSPPVIADFDGDGEPEIGIMGFQKIFILDRNGNAKQSLSIPYSVYGDTGGLTVAPTVFDLNGDGHPKVMTNSQGYFWIFDGKTGALLFKDEFGGAGPYQNVIVADVNGGGQAEIVVVGQDRFGANPTGDAMRVYGAKNNDWVGTRPIWNEPAYHGTNVNDDGSIPQYEAPSWLLNNNYRCNVPTSPSTNPYVAADLSASFVRVDMASYPSFVTITARIGNGGAKAVAPGVRTAFYDGGPANGGVLIGSAFTTRTLNPGDYEDVALVWSAPAEGNHTIQVVADADNTQAECDKTNNVVTLQVYVTTGKPDPSIVADDVVVPPAISEGSLANIVLTVRNVGTKQANNVLVRLYAGNPATGGKQIGADQVIPSIAAGGAASLTVTWNTLGSQGTTYLYALVDPAATVADANRGNNTAIKQLLVTPADKPDLQIAAEDITITPIAPTEGDPVTVAVDVHNRGVASGNVKVAFYNGNPATGGKLLGTATISQIIPFGGTVRATLAFDTIGLAGTIPLFVKVDPDNAIDESNKANNQASKTTIIGSAGLMAGAVTDKPAYSANENALITISVTDLKAQARSISYDIQILDASGISAAVAAADTPLQLGANATLAFNAIWNTGTTYSGAYTVGVRIKENGKAVAKATAPFTILPVKTAGAKVVADKTAYGANEQAAITATITGVSPNYIFTDLSAKLSVSDSAGQSLFTVTRAIPTLTNGQRVEVKGYWNTGTFAPGSYPATIEVKDASGAIIATGTYNLTISGAVKPSAVLKGQIVVDKQSLLVGETVGVSYSLSNVGNIDLTNVAVSVITVDVVNQTVYDTLTYQTPLVMGASYANTGQVDTMAYTAKDYLVILRANIAGVEETLAGTYFRVEGAPSAPALAGPANSADVGTFTPTLSVSNAADPNDDKLTYEFELYTDSGLANLIISSGMLPAGNGITAWAVPAPLTENRTCFWRARAYDGRLYGPWMTLASFRVNTVDDPPSAPTVSGPLDGTAVAVFTPILTINNSSDPDSENLTYNFDVALNPDFTQIAVSTKGVAGGPGTTSWTVPVILQENTWYYWRAQADDWLIEGPWSTTARFFVNTANDAPSAPVVTAPASGSTVAALATDIVAVNSTDPDSPTLSYYFEADTVPTFDSASIIRSGRVAEGEGTTLWHASGLQDNTRYYVRAKASDGTAESPWSVVTDFFANTVNDPPTMPILANPSNGAGVNVFTPTLSVHNATDPDKDVLTYEFEVYADAAMTNPVAQSGSIAETAQTTAWTVPVSLTENQTYYWRARAYDGALYSGWAPAASFMVNTANDAPGAPKLSSPAVGSSVATLTPTLAVVNAVDPDSANLTYEFEIYSGASLVTATTGVKEVSLGITAWTPGTPLADNSVYKWRARAYDGDSYGPWTVMATFTVHIAKASINATIDFDPDTLNRSSKGTWVVVYIELPAGYKPADVDISSIRLEGTIPAETWPFAIGDHDKDGIPDLMVKFKRSDVINLLRDGDSVPVHVTGKAGSTPFEGVDLIRVIQQ